MLFPSLRTTKKLFLTKPSFPGVLFSVLNGSNFFVQTLKLDCLKKKKKKLRDSLPLAIAITPAIFTLELAFQFITMG